MRRLVIATGLLLAGVMTAAATPINIGPNGLTYERRITFDGLNGITTTGQQISVDLEFSSVLHVFNAPGRKSYFPNLDIGLNLGIDRGEFLLAGSGYINGIVGDGSEFGSGVGGILGGGPDLEIMGLFPFLNASRTPVDVTSVHFDFTLPAGITITSGELFLHLDDFWQSGNHYQPMRIGPHVPEDGSTIAFLAIGLIAVIGLRSHETNIYRRITDVRIPMQRCAGATTTAGNAYR